MGVDIIYYFFFYQTVVVACGGIFNCIMTDFSALHERFSAVGLTRMRLHRDSVPLDGTLSGCVLDFRDWSLKIDIDKAVLFVVLDLDMII